jgi:hypothetical protein
MNRNAIRIMLLVAIAASCQSKPRPAKDNDLRVAAASRFTEISTQSRLAAWNVRASAAGQGCDVLLVETSIILEDSMVEALQYGAGAYAVVPGGIDRFYGQHFFRGVAYKDSTGRVWTYGNVTAAEAETLKRCE